MCKLNYASHYLLASFSHINRSLVRPHLPELHILRREEKDFLFLYLSSTSANNIAGTVGGGLEGSLKMTKVISLSFRPHAHTISLISLFLLVSFSLSIQKGVTNI